MTVAELISILQNHAADLRVVVNGYEDGYDDLSPKQLRVVTISLNTGEYPWEGAHGDPDDLSRSAPDDAKLVEALVLWRVSN